MKKKLKLTGKILLILLIVCLLLFIIRPKKITRFVRDRLGYTCIDYKQPVYSKKLTDKIPDYINFSIARGIRKCKNEDELEDLVSAGKLVKVRSRNGYIIQPMSHSYPYLTRSGKDLLDEISRRFRKKISNTPVNGSEFRVTSMTRTTDKLKNSGV
jgi:hypothetical protein